MRQAKRRNSFSTGNRIYGQKVRPNQTHEDIDRVLFFLFDIMLDRMCEEQ